MQWTSVSAKKRRKRNDEEGRGQGGDERGGAERGKEQRSMNGVELTDHNSPKHTRVPSHKHRQTHTGKLPRGREIKSYVEPHGRRGKEEEEEGQETKEGDEEWEGGEG